MHNTRVRGGAQDALLGKSIASRVIVEGSAAYTCGMSAPVHLDSVDLQILELLRADGRRTVRDIARLVQLSPAPVRRRIARLEETGVITGYTITTDQAKLGQGLQAVTELRFTGDTDIHDILEFASTLPEVDEVLTLTGDVDALVRLHVDSVDDLQKVVNRLRRKGVGVLQTKTLIVIDSWQRGTPVP